MQLPQPDQIAAERLRRSLRAFVADCFPVVDAADYLHNWHIDAVCDHLEAVSHGHLQKLIVNIPPRCMKSITTAVAWPAWEWLDDPGISYLFTSYASDLSERDGEKTMDLILSKGLLPEKRHDGDRPRTLLERYGYQGVLRLLGRSWQLRTTAKTNLVNDERGYRLASSVGAKATGFGGNRVVVDDPHNAKEAASDVKRPDTVRWWFETMGSRRNDPKRDAFVVIMQRLHEADLTGEILARDLGYTHLCLPMEYEPKHPFVWPDDPRTEPGELLWPERIGPDEVEELKKLNGSQAYAGQYQQRPAPAEGSLLKRRWWRYFPREWLEVLNRSVVAGEIPVWEGPRFQAIWQSWDTAWSEKTSADFTVGQLWGGDLANRYLLRLVRGRWAPDEAMEEMRTLHRWAGERWPRLAAHRVLVENTANAPIMMASLRREIPGIIPINPGTRDKYTRAAAITPQLEGGNVYVAGREDGAGSYEPALTPEKVQAFIEECAAFPNASHDDQVDALSQALDPRYLSTVMPRVDDSDVERAKPITAGFRGRSW